MAGTTLAVVIAAVLAAAGAAVLGWLWGAGRAQAAGLLALRAVEGDLGAARAAADELRRQLTGAAGREQALEAALADARRAAAVAETQRQDLRSRLDEQRALLDTAESRLGDTFRALAAEALQANTQGLMALAAEKISAAQRENDLALEARQKAIEG